jgi:hypothetical protein
MSNRLALNGLNEANDSLPTFIVRFRCAVPASRRFVAKSAHATSVWKKAAHGGFFVTSHYPQVAAARIKSGSGGMLLAPSSLSLR